MTPPRLVHLILAILLAWTLSAQAQTNRENLYIDEPRPVAAAAMSLMRRHSVVVTYEDPVYEFVSDMRDVTDQIPNRGNRPAAGPRVLVPKPGILHVSYDVSTATGKPVDMAEAVNAVLDVAAASPLGVRFRAQTVGQVVQIIPSEVKSRTGTWVRAIPVLDTPVTLRAQELNGLEILETVLAQVAQTTGVDIGLAAEEVQGSLLRYRGHLEASGVPARDVLLQALQTISGRLGWVLFYDPTVKYYLLTLTVIPADTTQPNAAQPNAASPDDPPPSRSGRASPAGPVQ